MDDTNTNELADIETSSANEKSDATVLLSLEELIKNNITAIDNLKIELKKQREMFDDVFNNDPVYKEHAEKAKEANKIKANTKAQIMKQPQVATLANKVKSLRSELKERQISLSDYLSEYQRMANVNEIQDNEGNVHEIVREYKLVTRLTSSK